MLIYPYKDFHSFLPFFSASETQKYLKNCYDASCIAKADQKSYENSYPFMYYLEHAQIYYDQSIQSPLHIQPILLFYGLVHLIKACLLTTDPEYPENTSMLAHGVSTRKRKKQQYEFFQDEVKFQKNGLFPCMLNKLYKLEQPDGDKLTMNELLLQIPELHSLFLTLEKKQIFETVLTHSNHLSFPKQLLDSYHMTENRLIEFLQYESSNILTFKESVSDYLLFDYADNGKTIPFLKYHLEQQYFLIPSVRGKLFNYPELVSHYLLLYNLSMIARYEVEWWSELIKTRPNRDYPFIVQFLNLTSAKGPFLIYQFLMNQPS